MEVDAVDFTLTAAPWPFATEQAAAIERHWQHRTAGNPHLYNGPVLLLHSGAVEAGEVTAKVFRGACFQTDFKTFMAWREFGFPETSVRNIFSMAAIEASDGAFILGEMAPHTAPAGQIYFPSGTPDPSDVKEDRVDIEGSAARELMEETGLGSGEVSFEPGLTLVMDDVRVCCMKPVRAHVTADVLAAKLHAWLARDDRPELARMHIVRTARDILPAMPDFVVAYLEYGFAQGLAR